MHFSKFGTKFTSHTGILQLMDDMGKAFAEGNKIMLGGGNPSHIPEVEAELRARMEKILKDDTFEKMVGDYDSPEGDHEFIEALVQLFKKEYDWDISSENIALTNGSQTSFFYLFNMFAGEQPNGKRKRILLPLTPEYIGYTDAGLDDDYFISIKPSIEFLGGHLFKYHVDFTHLNINEEVGAICVSRPTNPTGNVLTDEEIQHLESLAAEHDIPFIIDNAYGVPFPHIIFTEAKPHFNENTIITMSLSKIGLPGVRTGIVIAKKEVIKALSAMNAIIGLAPTSVGAHLAMDMVKTGKVIDLSANVVRPFYENKMKKAVEWFTQALGNTPYYIHKPEGALFLWLWFKDLPISSQELYERLKSRGVIVVPGNYFFPGLKEEWKHTQECIRVSYAQKEETVQKGIEIIAEEVKRCFK
jgi:valine--pyruvate aminotransferase